MSNPLYQNLLRRYLDDTLSPEELKQLIGFMREEQDQHLLLEAVGQALAGHSLQDSLQDASGKADRDALFENIMQKAAEAERTDLSEAERTDLSKVVELRRSRGIRPWLSAAAILLVVLTGAFYYWGAHKKTSVYMVRNEKPGKPSAGDVKPGHTGATLTLGDGTTISLDDSAKGELASQGNIKVIKLDNGQLSYHFNGVKGVSGSSGPGSGLGSPGSGSGLGSGSGSGSGSGFGSGEMLYNTVTTQRGEQYQIQLADGSKVWLNAASSLRFPTSFSGKTREVSLRGEAYFEIAGNKEMPFHVQAGEMKVEVLGTSFDVMAYEDEKAIRTTLVQGAVKVANGNVHTLLRPGQQANLDRGSAGLHVDEADIEEAVAWKNGFFQFNSADIESVMRQIGRWYNMETGYEGKVPGWHFSGSISRDTELSKVLKMLEMNDIHFRVEGKKIMVLP